MRTRLWMMLASVALATVGIACSSSSKADANNSTQADGGSKTGSGTLSLKMRKAN